MKVLGQHLIDFYRAWPPGPDVYHEDTGFCEAGDGTLCEEGEDWACGPAVDPARKYEVAGGLGWQGECPPPPGFDYDFARVLHRWIRARATAVLVFEVPREEADAAKALARERGWKVSDG